MSLRDIFRGFRNLMVNSDSDADHQGMGHGEGALTCRAALEMMDSIQPLSRRERARLEAHIASCPGCAAAARLEGALRATVAPENPPSPSAHFEADLLKELDLPPLVEPKPDPLARLTWVAVSIPLILMIVTYFRPISRVFYRVMMFMMTEAAGVLIDFDKAINVGIPSLGGDVNDLLSRHFGASFLSPDLTSGVVLSLALISVVIISGIVSVGYANRR